MLTSAYYRANSSSVMSRSAEHFLASLTTERRTKATFSFDNDERLNSAFHSARAEGPSPARYDAERSELARPLSAGLGQQGYIKAVTVVSLEDVLRILESDGGNRRNHGKILLHRVRRAVGHRHLGVSNRGPSSQPEFRRGEREGNRYRRASSARIRLRSASGHAKPRTLAAEEDLARNLLESLTPNRKKVAIVSSQAYKDIFDLGRAQGIHSRPALRAFGLKNEQEAARSCCPALVSDYAHNMPEQLAQARLERLKKAGSNLFFAWAEVRAACRATITIQADVLIESTIRKTKPIAFMRSGVISKAISAWICWVRIVDRAIAE